MSSEIHALYEYNVYIISSSNSKFSLFYLVLRLQSFQYLLFTFHLIFTISTCYTHYPSFTNKKTKAQNLILLIPNPVLFQGQWGQNNLTTSFFNSLAFIETSILKVKKTHKFWFRKLGKQSEDTDTRYKAQMLCTLQNVAKCQWWLLLSFRYHLPSF